ncbi:MAG TPA: hypothetical protein VH481_09925 [Nitrososphaeraceae archaeon]
MTKKWFIKDVISKFEWTTPILSLDYYTDFLPSAKDIDEIS